MKLKEPLEIAQQFLIIFSRRPVKRSVALKAVVKLSPSYGTAVSIFRELKQLGLIEKAGAGHFEPYSITRSGRKLLSALHFLSQSETEEGEQT